MTAIMFTINTLYSQKIKQTFTYNKCVNLFVSIRLFVYVYVYKVSNVYRLVFFTRAPLQVYSWSVSFILVSSNRWAKSSTNSSGTGITGTGTFGMTRFASTGS